MTSQWIGIGVGLLFISGLLYAFLRNGMTIKPDRPFKDHNEHT
jgi:hypothetical protein